MEKHLDDSAGRATTGEVELAPFRRGPGGERVPLGDPMSIFANRRLGEECLRAPGAADLYERTGRILAGDNMVVNLGRQTIANLIGGRDFESSPTNWVVSSVSFGTYDTAARFDDVTLSPQPVPGLVQGGANEILYDGTNRLKDITSVDWPEPFIVRFEVVLEDDEANGYLLREMGLWTANGNLFARKTFPGIAKVSDFGVSFLWRIRA